MYIDVVIFNTINGFAGRWQWLDVVGVFCAEYLGYILLFYLCILLAMNFKRHWRMVTEAVIAALAVRFILVELISRIRFRFRPFAITDVNLLIPFNAYQTSFPSGHASFFFALSTIVYAYHKKIGLAFYVASFLIAISRVFVGVHWPSDIIAGAVIGIVMGLILNRLFKKVNIKKAAK